MMNRIFPVAILASMFAAQPASARPVQLPDFYAIVGVSNVAIAPDGKKIAYVISRANVKDDRYDRTLMVYDLPARSSRAVTFERRDVSSPAWSPDGTKLAFIAVYGEGEESQQQVFVMDMRGGDAQKITAAASGVEQFAWRPDGSAIAYVTPDEAPNAKEIKKHLDGFVVGDQAYNDRAAPTPNHIWLVNADGSANKRLTSGAWSLPTATPPGSPGAPISWSPDGRSIAFTKMPNAYDADGDMAVISVVDVATGAIRDLTSHKKLESDGIFSPDGKQIAYWYPYDGDGAAQNDILIAPAAGGDGVDVTAADIDSNVQRAIWLPDGSLLVSGHKNTDAALWIKAANGRATRINLGDVQPVQGFWLDADVAKSGALAFAGSQPNRPVELYYMASVRDKPQRLTSYNDGVAALDLGKVQAVDWTSEGFSEDGTLTYPPNYDSSKKYPLVLLIHGGPNFASISSFSLASQFLAGHGWLVFSPNYRGSDNLGEKYWHAIVADAGAGPGRDVMAGIAAVERTASVDTSRIAVSGWSYGGYMTSWMIGHYHIWKSAVSGAAVNTLVDEYALADNGVGWRYQFGGSPWQHGLLQSYRDQSPISSAWQVTTPTLIMSDTGDQRVPITQSYEMFHALKDRGTPVTFWAFPVGGHSPGDPVRQADVYKLWADWIAKHF